MIFSIEGNFQLNNKLKTRKWNKLIRDLNGFWNKKKIIKEIFSTLVEQ